MMSGPLLGSWLLSKERLATGPVGNLLQDVDPAALQLRAGAPVQHQPLAGLQSFDDGHTALNARPALLRHCLSQTSAAPVEGSLLHDTVPP